MKIVENIAYKGSAKRDDSYGEKQHLELELHVASFGVSSPIEV